MKSTYRLACAALVAVVVFPCGMDTTPIFIPTSYPEDPDAAFVNGKLGILGPDLAARYKLIAWRYLSGMNNSPLEHVGRKQAVMADPKDFPLEPLQEWERVRKAAGPVANPFLNPDKVSRSTGAYYPNCLPGAFATAVKTLDDRRTRYADTTLLNAWISAQDQVFDNCSDDKPVYPPDPDSALPPLARADREYQIAAAHFYAEDLDGAEQRFRAISTETSSPWRDTAAYMIGRILIRDYTLFHKNGVLDRARAQLGAIDSPPFHDSAAGLIGYIDTVQHSSDYLQTLANNLAGLAFSDYWEEASYVLQTARFRDALAAPDIPEPFSWIRAMSAPDGKEALQQWRTTHSPEWLTAAIVHAGATSPDAPELIQAALTTPASSPAYDTVTHHAIRLLIATGKKDDARRSLDLLLSRKQDLDSVDNAFRAQRMSLATSFDDLLRWAPRRAIGTGGDTFSLPDEGHEPILDQDSAAIFNEFTPLSRLADAAESKYFSDWPRTQLAISTWTRAFELKDFSIADREVPLLEKTRPAWKSDLEAFRSASGDAKAFAGAILIERHSEFKPSVTSEFKPGKDIYTYGPYWWCYGFRKEDSVAPPVEALSEAEQNDARRELDKLRDEGLPLAVLSPMVMAWANTHPADSRVPEALHRIVRMSRYGCGGADTGKFSRAAFDVLHKKYPSSPWTRQTPYWFGK